MSNQPETWKTRVASHFFKLYVKLLIGQKRSFCIICNFHLQSFFLELFAHRKVHEQAKTLMTSDLAFRAVTGVRVSLEGREVDRRVS